MFTAVLTEGGTCLAAQRGRSVREPRDHRAYAPVPHEAGGRLELRLHPPVVQRPRLRSADPRLRQGESAGSGEPAASPTHDIRRPHRSGSSARPRFELPCHDGGDPVLVHHGVHALVARGAGRWYTGGPPPPAAITTAPASTRRRITPSSSTPVGRRAGRHRRQRPAPSRPTAKPGLPELAEPLLRPARGR